MVMFILGFSVWLVIGSIFYAGYYVGKRHRGDIEELTPKEKQNIKEKQEQINNLFNYNASVAYKKVM